MIAAIIQARMGSTRLPNKIMINILDKPVLWHVINRTAQSKYIDKIVVATTNTIQDDVVCDFCTKKGIEYYRGSELDVLDRFYKCAKYYNVDTIVRVTSDCPLIDHNIIDKVISHFSDGNYDYVSNIDPPTYPDGQDVEVFSFDVLEKVWIEAKLKSEREHVTPYIRKNKNKFKFKNVENEIDLSSLRWTLDQEEDLAFIQNIYCKFGKYLFSTDDILKLLEKYPELLIINKHISRNEGYIKSLKED